MVLYVAMSQGGGESSSVLSRLRFLTLTDISRLRFLAIPAGLVTALVLFIPTKLDREGRALLVTCWCTFAFFAVSSFISLHHFLLPMFLPIVIFWRSELCRSKSTAIAASLGSLIVVVALLMNNPTPNTQLTSLSQRVAFSSAPKERHHEALDMAAKLLTVEATTTYATTDGYRHALARIILHKAPASPSASTEFWVIDSDDPIPANWVMVARNDSHVLIEPRNRTIRSLRVQEVSYAHPLLFIPLEQKFRHLGEARGNFDIDLRTICPWQ
jgi:hypothetical protein